MSKIFAPLMQELLSIKRVHHVGRVVALHARQIEVSGLHKVAALGDRVSIRGGGGEIVALHDNRVTVLPEEHMNGLAIDDKVLLTGPLDLAPDARWIGRLIDPLGRPLDGRPLFPGEQKYSLNAGPPPAAQRRRLGERLATGKAALDTLLPIVRGQRIGLFAGSGVGKSSLLGHLARVVQADVVVIGLVGERGRELREFVDTVLGPEGLAKSVIVTATSDQSPLLRRRCALSAMAVAEYFRDQGAQVLLLMDSVTRFAEAHREIALTAGEPATLRGYPPSLQHLMMALAERAGPGTQEQGDITAIFSVLVAGSDMEEPVADILRGVLDGHIVLERKIAERGRFPAIDVLRSLSRALPHAASPQENAMISDARKVMGAWDRAEMMVQAGLYQKGSDPEIDRALRVMPALEVFLAEDAPRDGIQNSFKRLSGCLALT